MFKSIYDDIRYAFNTGNMVIRLMIINTAVFIVLALLEAFTPSGSSFYTTLESFLALPGSPMRLLTRPWTILTHMFVHAGFWHLLWNMLYLYWFGRIVGDLLGDKVILPLYLMGGLVGGIAYILSYQIFPNQIGPYAVGASAAIMAIVATAGFKAPDYNIRLILIGDVKLKYIVFFIFLMDLIGAAGNTNSGGHIAHLGGFLLGFLYVRQRERGVDILEPLSDFIKKATGWFYGNPVKARKSNLKVKYKSTTPKSKPSQRNQPFQEKLDMILDKIADKGYDSLSDEEKEFLFQASKK